MLDIVFVFQSFIYSANSFRADLVTIIFILTLATPSDIQDSIGYGLPVPFRTLDAEFISSILSKGVRATRQQLVWIQSFTSRQLSILHGLRALPILRLPLSNVILVMSLSVIRYNKEAKVSFKGVT